MENLLIIVSFVFLSLIFAKYLPSYFNEKAKNLATKEDIEGITTKIENVKFEVDNNKFNTNKKKDIYEQITESLNIFISGRSLSSSDKEKFYKSYSLAWLWASEEVVEKLNIFLEYQIEKSNMCDYSQEKAKELYSDIILSMRKDLNLDIKNLTINNYKFVTFNK